MALATRFTINFKNSTDTPFYFGVFQNSPEHTGLRSLVWQVRHVPAASMVSSIVRMDWATKYGVATAQFDSQTSKFTTQCTAGAEIGHSFIVKNRNNVLTIDSVEELSSSASPAAEGPPQIKMINKTKKRLFFGLTLDGNLLAVSEAERGKEVTFEISRTFHVALFRNMEAGHLATDDTYVSPTELEFPDGYGVATVDAVMSAGLYELDPPTYRKNMLHH